MDDNFKEMVEKMKTLSSIERAQYFSDLGRWRAEMDFRNKEKMRSQSEFVEAFDRRHDLKKVCEIIIWIQDGYTYELNMN